MLSPVKKYILRPRNKGRRVKSTYVVGIRRIPREILALRGWVKKGGKNIPIFILKGPTGCGKTYQAMMRPNKNKKVLYGGPCRQLIYETACNYGNIHSNVVTSDICIGDAKNYNKSFRTYECINYDDVRRCDVLVIDEAHFMSDKDRGPHLKDIINFGNKIGKKVVLLSATMDFSIKGAKIINLPARGKQFIREEVSRMDCIKRMQSGIPTLYFHKYRDDCGYIGRSYGIKTGVITSETSVADRVKIIDAYMKGKITLIESTNAMAQGVNVPCENLINEYNSWDTPATVIQKIGRLGRTGVTKEGVRLTYNLGGYSADEVDDYKDLFEISEEEKPQINLKTKGRKFVKDYDLLTPATENQKQELKNRIIKHWHCHA